MPLSIVKERSFLSEFPDRGMSFDQSPFAGWVNGAGRNRTGDLRRAKPALSQLSYSPSSLRISSRPLKKVEMVGLSGVEPLTSRLSGVRSSQLSYRPNVALSWSEVIPAKSPLQPSEQRK